MKKIYVVWTQYESTDYDFDGAFSNQENAKKHQKEIINILENNGYKPGNLLEYENDYDCYVNIETVEIKDYLYV